MHSIRITYTRVWQRGVFTFVFVCTVRSIPTQNRSHDSSIGEYRFRWLLSIPMNRYRSMYTYVHSYYPRSTPYIICTYLEELLLERQKWLTLTNIPINFVTNVYSRADGTLFAPPPNKKSTIWIRTCWSHTFCGSEQLYFYRHPYLASSSDENSWKKLSLLAPPV